MSKKYIIKNGIAVEVSDKIFEFLKKPDWRIKYVGGLTLSGRLLR